MEDSLRVVDSPEGGLMVEWHPDDPRYKYLDGLTEEQINDILKESIIRALEDQK
jgi:hypothetical protein